MTHLDHRNGCVTERKNRHGGGGGQLDHVQRSRAANVSMRPLRVTSDRNLPWRLGSVYPQQRTKCVILTHPVRCCSKSAYVPLGGTEGDWATSGRSVGKLLICEISLLPWGAASC